MKTCPKCGYKNDNDSKFCINCGADIALTPTSEQRQAEEQLRRQQADAEKAEKQRQAEAEKAAREQEKQRAKEQKDAERAAIKAQQDAERAAAKAQKEADRAAKKAAAGAGKAAGSKSGSAGSKSGSAGSKTGTATSTTGKRLSPALIAVIAVVAIAAILTGIHFSPLGPIFTKRQDLKAQIFDFDRRAFECGKEPTETYVYAVFDSTEKLSGLKLTATCVETGEKIELTDDGLGADDVAGDNVFKGSASFASSEEKTLTYKLSSNTRRKPVSAPDAKVVFYTNDSVRAELDRVDTINAELDAIAAANPVDRTQSDEKVEEEYTARVSKIIEALEQKKANGEIVDYKQALPYVIVDMPVGAFVYDLDELAEGVQSSGGGHGGAAGTHDGTLNWDDPYLSQDSVNKMLVALPYEDNNDPKHINSSEFTNAAGKLEASDLGYASYVVRSGGFNKEVLLSLDKFRVIAINSHGGCDDTYGLIFGLGTNGYDFSVDDYSNYYIFGGNSRHAFVTYRFFEHYYKDKRLNDCLIYLGCCHTFDDSKMVSTLLRCGASVVIGFDNSVYNNYNQAIFKTLFSELMKDDPEDTGITQSVSSAFNETIRVNGDEDPTPVVDKDYLSRLATGLPRNNDKYTYAHPFLVHASGLTDFRLIDKDTPKTGKLTIMLSAGINPNGPYITHSEIEIKGFTGFYDKLVLDGSTSCSVFLPIGGYELTVSSPGYLPTTKPISIIFRNENVVHVVLEPDPAVATAVDDLLNGVFWPMYHDPAMINEHRNTDYVRGFIYFRNVYSLLHQQDPARYPHPGLDDINESGGASYTLPAEDEARMRAAGMDPNAYGRYYLEDVQAVLDRIYGKGRVTPAQFFGSDCFVTSDGYMLYPGYGTDYLLTGWNRYFIRDIQQTADGLDVTVSCVYLDYCYAYDDFGIFATPMTGTYMLYDMVADKRLAEDSDDSLKTESDYPVFLKNLNVESIGAATTVLHMFIDSDGAHLK